MTALNVLSTDQDAATIGIASRCEVTARLGTFHELRVLLRSVEGPIRVLNLIGHSTRAHHYLRFGTTPLDMLDLSVARLFEGIAADGLVSRLGISEVRLLGCETAVEVAGQLTIRLLARTLGVRVFGTRKPLMKGHYNGREFDPRFEGLLISDQELSWPLQRLEPVPVPRPFESRLQ